MSPRAFFHTVVVGVTSSFFSVAEPAAPLAFPGARGAGAHASGGRGGVVVHVTNLQASGPGSFADAVSAGDRIVVFDVSGVIDLAETKAGKEARKGGKIEIAHPNLTILGQTAPGEGICLKGGALHIGAGNVIVRYLRSRRGFIADGDAGDAIEVKPGKTGEKMIATGQSPEALDRKRAKKAARGKEAGAFADLDDVVIDHCSASWATDENLTMTHVGRATISHGIAAEGLDYANAKQTPPNHSEGSLWGSSASDGRSTLHHTLFANNRLRNPRTTGGADEPAVLTMSNCVVYNWIEYATHTGSERVHLQWLNNFYKPGPDTPAELRGNAFQFHGDPLARVYARGNFIDGDAAATADNRRAIGWNQKFKNATAETKMAMIVDQPFADLPAQMQSATEAYRTVLAEAGATLPARDAVDLRIIRGVRDGTGRVIDKESDLPAAQRWPTYHALPPLPDRDGDGLPDFWEKQFGLNPEASNDAAQISASGYANIEHYANNTDPTGNGATIVHVSATVSRATPGDPGEWQVSRSGDLRTALTVRYTTGGDARSGADYEELAGSVTIPVGRATAVIALKPRATAPRIVVITLDSGQPGCAIGCPAAALVGIEP